MEHKFSDMQPREAQNGGLDHHVMTCSCGYEAASTMPTLVVEYAVGHLEYQRQKERGLNAPVR